MVDSHLKFYHRLEIAIQKVKIDNTSSTAGKGRIKYQPPSVESYDGSVFNIHKQDEKGQMPG